MTENVYKIKIRIKNAEFEVVGDKDFVESKYLDYKENILPKIIESNYENVVEKKKDSTQENKKLLLIDFYKLKKPKNHNEKILLIANWLLNNESIEEFQPTKDILHKYDEIKIKKPSNIHQHIGDLKNDGLIMDGSKTGFYKLTLSGIDFIEKNLPKLETDVK